MTPQEAAQQVIKELDRLGEKMSPEDWINLCEEVESICYAKAEATKEELDDELG